MVLPARARRPFEKRFKRGVGRFNSFCKHSLEMGQVVNGLEEAAGAARAVFTKAVALSGIQTKPLADAHLGASGGGAGKRES